MDQDSQNMPQDDFLLVDNDEQSNFENLHPNLKQDQKKSNNMSSTEENKDQKENESNSQNNELKQQDLLDFEQDQQSSQDNKDTNINKQKINYIAQNQQEDPKSSTSLEEKKQDNNPIKQHARLDSELPLNGESTTNNSEKKQSQDISKEDQNKEYQMKNYQNQEKQYAENRPDFSNVQYLNDNRIAVAKGQRAGKGNYLGVDERIYHLESRSYDSEKIIMQCKGLTKEFKIVGRDEAVVALKDITLHNDSEFKPIRLGEFVMIRGPSGCGKTTFLNLLGSIDMSTGGRIEIMGDVIDSKSTDTYLSKLRLEKIGFVFQTFNLLATMTAFENVELPMRVNGKLNEKQMKKRTRELLQRVGLGDRMEHLPSELSGGEQQRVAIARALANSPQILLLDEPTGDLDTRSTVEIMNLLLSINNFGYSKVDDTPVTMIMVTHNPDIEMYADRILYFRDGSIIEQSYNEKQIPIFWEDYVNFLNQQN